MTIIGLGGLLGAIAMGLASPAAAELVFVTWNIDGGQQTRPSCGLMPPEYRRTSDGSTFSFCRR